MPVLNHARKFLALTTVAILAAAYTTARADIELPRYHLVPGQQIEYRGSSRAEHQDHPQMDTTDTTLKAYFDEAAS